MSVPPAGPPSSTPPSKGRNEPEKSKKDRGGKEFELPGKKQKKDQEVAADVKSEEFKSQTQMADKVEVADKTQGIEAKAQVAQVSKLILKMVTEFQVGQVGGKEFAQARLSGADAPEAFAGSNLTLSYAENGLSIKFTEFQTPLQAQNAQNLVEHNKEQLTQLVQALQAKNIHVSELNIGGNRIELPQAQPLPPPFQPTAPSAGEARREGGQGGQGDEGGGGGPTE